MAASYHRNEAELPEVKMREWLSRRWLWLVLIGLVGYSGAAFLLLWLFFAWPGAPFSDVLFGEPEARKYYEVTQGMTTQEVMALLGEPRRRYPPGTTREQYHPGRGGPDWPVSQGEIWRYESLKGWGYCYVLFDESGRVKETFVELAD
ncbi:MAG: hypothetical protein JXA57_02960 [Armatimonadetes bacterium]|nr:hypothetical protein [Armatimonadota bacterium]